MAYYRAIGSAQHAELDDGLKLGFAVHDASALNGRKLVKGAGAIRLKEVDSHGKPIPDGRDFAFTHGEVITV